MPARSHEAWSDEDIAMLRRMHAQGAKTAEIARALERTRAATETRAQQLKLHLRS